jgi:ubiquinone/menaquinone biosynthesis C-methylase UbiE
MKKTSPKSNIEWKYWGEHDLLFGVAAWQGKEKSVGGGWTDNDFYNLGKSDWEDFLNHWEKYGVRKESIVEIGCGAGRLTKHMALTFEKVIGLDVSDGMISYAKKKCQEEKNVEFILIDGVKIPIDDNTISAVFSSE